MSDSTIKRGIHYIKKNGIWKFGKKVLRKIDIYFEENVTYNVFLRNHRLAERTRRQESRKEIMYWPCISIVVPLFHTPEVFLHEMIESVIRQTYSNWQLCLADGSSTDELGKMVQEWYPNEERIVYKHINSNLGIAGNTNVALELANGEFIALVDHDDILETDALFTCVEYINSNRLVQCLYSDEDKIDAKTGRLIKPHFKSDYNIDLLRAHNYITHLFVFSRELYEQVGGFDSQYDGAQDYDLILRCVEEAQEVVHIPKVLYHWRCHEQSTAMNPESKIYAWENGRRALQAHFDRCQIPAEVSLDNCIGFYHVDYHFPEVQQKKVIMYPISDRKSNNTIWKEIKSIPGDYVLFLDETVCDSLKVLKYSEMNENIKDMLSVIMREDVEVVGGQIFDASGKIRHGLEILSSSEGVKNAFSDIEEEGYYRRNKAIQDVSVVSAGCMMIEKQTFISSGGFSEDLLLYRGEDYCLRNCTSTRRVVFVPWAGWKTNRKLSAINRNKNEERCMFMEKWKNLIAQGDFCYNCNLNHDQCDFRINISRG